MQEDRKRSNELQGGESTEHIKRLRAEDIIGDERKGNVNAANNTKIFIKSKSILILLLILILLQSHNTIDIE